MRKNPFFKFAIRLTGTVLSLGVFFFLAPKMFAQDPDPLAVANELKTAINIMWMLLCGFLVARWPSMSAWVPSSIAWMATTVLPLAIVLWMRKTGRDRCLLRRDIVDRVTPERSKDL